MAEVTTLNEAQNKLGEKICAALAVELEKLELEQEIAKPQWQKAKFNLVRDPALGDESLEALWLNERGAKLGSVVLHADGSFFAEYDVIRPHPRKTRWFIEAVSVWGRDDDLRSEARLLPMPE